MYVVANRVPVKEAWYEEFEERFRRRAGEIDKQPGFVRMQILRPTSPDLTYVVLTTWESEGDFEAWIGSEDFKIAHQNPMSSEAFAGKPAMERHHIVISAEKA